MELRPSKFLAMLLCLLLCLCLLPAAFAQESSAIDFEALANTIATAQGQVYVEGEVRIERDLVIPEGVTLKSRNGRVIIPAGVTLTVNGELNTSEIELYGKIINNGRVTAYWRLTLPGDDINRHFVVNPGSEFVVDSRFWPESLFDLDFSAGTLKKRVEVYNAQEMLRELGNVPELDHYSVIVQVCDSFTVPFGNTVTVPVNCILNIESGQGGGLSLSAGVDMRVDGELYLENVSITVPGTLTNNGRIKIRGASVTATDELINNGEIILEDYNNQQPHLTASNLSGEGVIRVPARGSREENLKVLDIPGSEGFHALREGNFVLLYHGNGENIYDELAAMIAEGRKEIDFLGRGHLTLPESGSITIPAGTVCTFNYITADVAGRHLSEFLHIPEGFNLIVEGELNLGANGLLDGQITAQNGGRVDIPGVFNWGENGHIHVNNAYSSYSVTHINARPDEVYIIEGDSRVSFTGWRIESNEALQEVMDYVAPDERIEVDAVISSDMTVDAGLTLMSNSTRVIVPENVTLTIKGTFRPMELVVKEGGSLVVDGGELTVGKLVVEDGGSCDVVNGGTLTETEGGGLDAFEALKQAIAENVTEFDMSDKGIVTFYDSIEIPAGMQVNAQGTEIVVPVNRTLTVSGTLKVMKMNVQNKGNVVVNRGILNTMGGGFELEGSLRVVGTPVQVGTGSWNEWLRSGATGRITYEDGGSLTLLRVVDSDEQLADAFSNTAQYNTEHTSYQINVAYAWTVSGKTTIPEGAAVFVVVQPSAGSLTVARGGALNVRGKLMLPPDSGLVTNNGEIHVSDHGEIRLRGRLRNDGHLYLEQRPADMKDARLTCQPGASYEGYGVFLLEDASDPYSLISGLSLDNYTLVHDTKHPDRISLTPAESYIFGTDTESFNWEVHGFKEQCESGVVDHIELRGLEHFVFAESMTIPRITTVEVYGGTVEIPAGVVVDLTKGRLILHDGAVLNILRDGPTSAQAGNLKDGTLEVDEGCTVNVMGKRDNGALRLDGTLTAKDGGAWWEWDMTGLVNGRPKGRMTISCAGQHDVNVKGLDEAKLMDWVSFEGDDASLRLVYHAKSDADFTAMTERIRNLPERFYGRMNVEYDAVIRGNVDFPGMNITVDGSLLIAEGAVLTAPTIHSKEAEITVSGTFISRNPKYDHSRALSLQGPGSKLTVTQTGIIGGDDCTIEFSKDITDPAACLSGIRFEQLKYAHDPMREGAGFLTYQYIPEMSLPAALNTIESEALAGGSFDSVYIPAGVTSIASDAFGDRSGLKIYGEYGSAAERFAAQKGFPFAQLNWSDYPMYNAQ